MVSPPRQTADRTSPARALPVPFCLQGFFPFPDGIQELARVGVKAIIQPGGSINDKKIIKSANKAGMVMVFTGTRHFKH